MTDKYRVFYTRDGARGTQSVDCIINDEGESTVYKVTDGRDDASAIKVSSGESKVLLEDGSVESIKLGYVHDMEAQYEQYVYGGSASATKTYVRFFGPHTGRNRLPQYGSEVNVRVNGSVIIRGDSDSTTSEWEWEILSRESAEFVKEDDDLSDFFGKTCISIGFSEPVNTVEMVRPVFVSEDED